MITSVNPKIHPINEICGDCNEEMAEARKSVARDITQVSVNSRSVHKMRTRVFVFEIGFYFQRSGILLMPQGGIGDVKNLHFNLIAGMLSSPMQIERRGLK